MLCYFFLIIIIHPLGRKKKNSQNRKLFQQPDYSSSHEANIIHEDTTLF